MRCDRVPIFFIYFSCCFISPFLTCTNDHQSTMKPRLHPTPTLFALLVIIAIHVMFFPPIWCQDTRSYDVCRRPVECGNITLEYPFWGGHRPDYCGHPGFQLTCQSDVPLLSYESVEYQVLETETSTKTITVARNDLQSTLCPGPLHNTTYNFTLFNGDSFGQVNVSLYYGCDSSTIPTVTNFYRFSCDGTNSYFSRTDSADSVLRCNSSIRVPVSQSWGNQIGAGAVTESGLRSALAEGFNLEWSAYNDECEQCIQSNGKCGSNTTSPELFACYCASGNFSLTCDNTDQSGVSYTGHNGSNNTMIKIIRGVLLVTAGIIVLLFIMLCRKRWLRKTRLHGTPRHLHGTARNHQIEMFIKNYGILTPKRFKYSEIKKMTNSFLEKLGQGGYGSVYKGQLPDGQLVAVKLLSEATGDGEDFINEVASISRTSHVNIVTLLGFCVEGKKRALIYAFMPNASLDKFLHGDGSHLDWNTLFRIAKGIARGLEYLHQGCNTRIVHFDIKPHNILLDEEFIPKIADFGLAKLCKKKQSIVSVIGARGTAGYMAPEVFFRSLGGASHKSDVYSYGMMVLEMTGASKNINSSLTSASEAYFPNRIYKQVQDGDNLGFHGLTNEVEEELARKMVTVSLWCIQFDPLDRPSISKVVEMLEGSFESLQVPPRRFWSSPTRPVQGSSSLAIQSSTSEGLSIVQATGEDSLPDAHSCM